MSFPTPTYDFNAKIMKLLRSLERHKKRYIKAWMAHYGAHPADVQIVMFPKPVDVFGFEHAEIMRMEFKKDSDPVVELVRAARKYKKAVDHDYPEFLPSHFDDEALATALKPFENVPNRGD